MHSKEYYNPLSLSLFTKILPICVKIISYYRYVTLRNFLIKFDLLISRPTLTVVRLHISVERHILATPPSYR